MIKSPCLTCEIHRAGFSKKNEPACRHCESAQAYSDMIGPMTASLPVEMTDLARRPDSLAAISPPGAVVIGRWRRAYDAVCRICEKNGIRTCDLHSGRKSGAITAARREIVRQLSQMNVGTERIANFAGVEISSIYYHQVRLGLRSCSKMLSGNSRYRQKREDANYAAAMPAL